MTDSSGPPTDARGGKDLSVCRRLERLREEQFGPRGKSEMARRLDIRPSTYDRYERDRVPPADLLVKIARVADVTLEWLLTGEGPKRPPVKADVEAEALTRQFQEAITVRPGLRPGISRLLDWVESQPRPAGGPPAADAPPPEVSEPPSAPADPPPAGPQASAAAATLVPVVGSTSAGLARRWEELPDDFGGPEADRRIEDILASRPTSDGPPARLTGEPDAAASGPVSLVQSSSPDGEGFVEFVDAAELRRAYPDAVAWRIDGDSMAPRYVDGDLVVTSASQPAVAGQPCVARQKGQIGVNCKVYQAEGGDVLLIPINVRHDIQRVPAERIEWAHRVLGVISLGR